MTKKQITVLVNDTIDNSQYINFLKINYDINIVNATHYNNEKIDLILFIGGEDVNPAIYGENIGNRTYINQKRDEYERRFMFQYKNFKTIPKLGICRGAQFLTVMSGGKLIQHVNNHAIGGTHPIYFKDPYGGEEMDITSTHHQMMYPYNLKKEDYKIIAASSRYLSTTYLNGDNEERELDKKFEECEIVFYPLTNSLCIQGHPEHNSCPSNTKVTILDLIKYLLKL